MSATLIDATSLMAALPDRLRRLLRLRLLAESAALAAPGAAPQFVSSLYTEDGIYFVKASNFTCSPAVVSLEGRASARSAKPQRPPEKLHCVARLNVPGKENQPYLPQTAPALTSGSPASCATRCLPSCPARRKTRCCHTCKMTD